jgi:hypothetical protein
MLHGHGTLGRDFRADGPRPSIADGSTKCDTNAACSDTDGSFTCACNSGYSGNGVSCANVNECTGVPLRLGSGSNGAPLADR